MKKIPINLKRKIKRILILKVVKSWNKKAKEPAKAMKHNNNNNNKKIKMDYMMMKKCINTF